MTTHKVFGIGFHKTGTTSLARALRILGYRVTGPKGVTDPNISTNALAVALKIAAQFEAFHGNPWTVLFKEIDAAFPESKFILTERPVDRWIESVVRHFGTNSTPMRQWMMELDCHW